MARVDYSGVNQDTPELQAPDDYQHVQASPAAFGAGLSPGLDAIGQGALDASKFYGQVAADNGTNNTLQQVTAILHGDPNKMVAGPDGQLVPDTGFFGKRGADAMNAREETSQNIDEAIRENREALTTPEARLQYDADTRRYRAQWQNEMGTYSDGQQTVWARDTNNTTAQLALNAGARSLSDPDASSAALETVRKSYVRNAQLNGENADGAVLKADQTFYTTQIKSALGTDPATAQKILDDHSDVLASTPGYDELVHQVKTGVINATLSPAADSFVNTALASAHQNATGLATAATGVTPKVSGGTYDQIEQFATKAGATPAEVARLKREAQLESSGKTDARNGSSTGLFQFHPTTFAGLGGTDIHDTEQQTAAALKGDRNNGATLAANGVAATDANLYLMHQQGPAGGVALLTAPHDADAVATLAEAYGGDTAKATQAIAGNIGMPYKTPEQRAAANQAATEMTTGQFVDKWAQRWGGTAGAGSAASGVPTTNSQRYPSTADALNANMAQNLAAAQVQAEKLFPNYPDAQERFVQRVERQLNQTVDQQRKQYEVDAHIVQSAMAGPTPPISEEQLIAKSPQVAAAWNSLLFNNPYARMSIENRFDANAKGKALTYGTGFKDYFDRATAPMDDPNRITDPLQLNQYVGSGDSAPLTNTGSDALTSLLASRGTPQGEAFASQARAFVDAMHAELTYSNKSTGVIDPEGEKVFSNAMVQVLPMLEAANKNGNLAKVLDPKNPDYLGNMVQTFARTPAKVVHDRLTGEGHPNLLTEIEKQPSLGGMQLQQAVGQGQITPAEAAWIANRLGIAKPRAAPSATVGAGAQKSQFLQAPAPEVNTIDPATGKYR